MMWRTPEEKAALRESIRKMDTAQKAEYIFTYYKWFILLGIIALVILSNTVYRQLTKKNVVLYLGYANVTAGEELQHALTADFLDYQELNPKKEEILVYNGLYLSGDASAEDHQYAYASRMKVMASVNAKKLDVVLMNREAYDLLSNSGYLLPLTELPEALLPYTVENIVVLEDNSVDLQLNNAEEYIAVTESVANGLDISTLPLIREAGFSDTVYAGIIANTPRPEMAANWLLYLLEENGFSRQ